MGTRNIKPDLYFYKGGYTNVTQCEECEAIGMYENLHPVDPCPYCGGKILDEKKAAIWIKPVYKYLFFGKIKDGYWRLKDGN